MRTYDDAQQRIKARPRTWLVTGVAGFIGSHLAENLLRLGPAGGRPGQLRHRQAREPGRCSPAPRARRACATSASSRATSARRRPAAPPAPGSRSCCTRRRSAACRARSRTRSATHAANVTGFLNMLLAARDAGVKRFVYASSSAVYGDHPVLPKVEERIGQPRSRPTACPSTSNELYAERLRALLRLLQRSGCATSTSSARARIPTAPTRR